MDYFELVKNVNPCKTAIIEDGNVYTYGQVSDMALKLAGTLLKKKVFIIKEDGILKQLVAFLACNAAGIVPVIVPSDAKKMPEINDVPEDACMAVMTSGTAGIPKLLYRTYKSWAGFFPVQNEIFGINKESILFAHGSLAFTGNLNLYMAQFYAGGTVVAENKFNPRRWADIIEKENVNAVYLIPSKLMLLPDIIKGHNNNVKSVISGSQSLGIDDARKLKKIFPMSDITLYYGASELSYVTYVKYKDMKTDRNFIGKPFPGVKVSIKDGMIYVDSKYHAEGINCPYSVSDNGYMDKEGNLYFQGRSDDIVLIHGRKISLINIENELEKMEDIREAAVVSVLDNQKNILIAFISIKSSNININDIFSNLRKTLAHYEMPCKIIVSGEIPHNGSGKKDKKKILEIYGQKQ
ncbi:MAG: AMP-binding protein [Lachnospiraceae bacterium]|nr:AMP-binding protein [Lachnospiraceae bacterium]